MSHLTAEVFGNWAADSTGLIGFGNGFATVDALRARLLAGVYFCWTRPLPFGNEPTRPRKGGCGPPTLPGGWADVNGRLAETVVMTLDDTNVTVDPRQEMVIPRPPDDMACDHPRSSDARNTAILVSSVRGDLSDVPPRFSSSRIAGLEPTAAIRHRRGQCYRVQPHLLGCELRRHRSGDRCGAALRGSVAVAAGDAHQSDVGRHVDD